jgi:CRP-like cAMP-binding protein
VGADEIERYIRALCAPPADELAALLGDGRSRTIEAGAYFCEPGQALHEVGFLHEGLGRYHVLTEAGDDVTKDFALPGRFAVSFGSAVQGQPAQVAISAVVRSRLTVWPFSRLRGLIEGHPEWQRFGRRVAEWLYVRKERRELDLLMLSATERYARARDELGPTFGMLPRQVLASYLGIAPESLSRLRSRLVSSRRARASSLGRGR